MSVSREDVVWAYRMILGREPESDAVINEKLNGCNSIDKLRAEMLTCTEFNNKQQKNIEKEKSVIFTKYNNIEFTVSEDILKKMFLRISDEWEKLGNEEPYWSILTSDKFKSKTINANIDFFNASGKKNASLIDVFCQRSGIQVPSGVCLELGCGVGRVTQFLAQRFEKVIAVDVSTGNMEICKELILSRNINNVKTLLIKSPNEYQNIVGFDFLFSTIVLQHNTPPLQRYILDILLRNISENGVCLFQIPTHIPGYSFSVNNYMKSKKPVMEMHSIPMRVIFDILDKHNFLIREVIQDHFTGMPGSYTFFAVKK